MYIISNRNVQPQARPEKRFGETYNAEGPTNLRVARAKYERRRWSVELIDEPARITSRSRLPSEQVYKEIMRCMRREQRQSLLYVHGFNTSFRDLLERARKLEETYDVELVCFTWPSNPGGFITSEYRQARIAAEVSAPAFGRAVDKLIEYQLKYESERCAQSVNLLIHSMGNYMFRRLVESPVYDQRRLLRNIVIAASDVDSAGHQDWLKLVNYCKRLYVTINEQDSVLRISEKVNPPRLGNTLDELVAERVKYMDFSNASGVGNGHSYFLGDALANPEVHRFFSRAIRGQRAEAEVFYDQRLNAYRIP
jgi:esterase/lipase superfamily enzyme